jgi:hypothetical protein
MARKPPPFEGSPKDIAQDKKGARKLGVGLRAYERTPRDKAEDKKGQKAMAGRFGRK